MVIDWYGYFYINYKGKTIRIYYHFWILTNSDTAGVILYDKHQNEYRFARDIRRKKWTAVSHRNKWPIEFRKAMAAELEKFYVDIQEAQEKRYKENQATKYL